MYERKRKSSSLNSGETILIKKRLTENYSTTMKWPCYQETSNQNRNENLSNIDGHHFSSCSKPNSNQKLTVIDSNTTGYFPYPDINYKPRMCRMCAAGDSVSLFPLNSKGSFWEGKQLQGLLILREGYVPEGLV